MGKFWVSFYVAVPHAPASSSAGCPGQTCTHWRLASLPLVPSAPAHTQEGARSFKKGPFEKEARQTLGLCTGGLCFLMPTWGLTHSGS